MLKLLFRCLLNTVLVYRNATHVCNSKQIWLSTQLFLCTTHSPLPAGSLMSCRICMLHIQVERISHWWQQCWSIKDSTFYPENSANSGGQLTPRQPGSKMSWRFLPCGRRRWPQSRRALCWCIGHTYWCVSWCVCVSEGENKSKDVRT